MAFIWGKIRSRQGLIRAANRRATRRRNNFATFSSQFNPLTCQLWVELPSLWFILPSGGCISGYILHLFWYIREVFQKNDRATKPGLFSAVPAFFCTAFRVARPPHARRLHRKRGYIRPLRMTAAFAGGKTPVCSISRKNLLTKFRMASITVCLNLTFLQSKQPHRPGSGLCAAVWVV